MATIKAIDKEKKSTKKQYLISIGILFALFCKSKSVANLMNASNIWKLKTLFMTSTYATNNA